MRNFCILQKCMLFILTVLLVTGCDKKQEGEALLQIKGSDTEVNLVQRLAEEFMRQRPGVSIAVTGGGSGTGIAALINGQTDIANSSRPMKAEEIKQAGNKGVNPVAVVFAIDGLALIVHRSLSVGSLTLEQLAGIYRGDISNWAEVGGPDLQISLYGRQSNSGTHVFFRDGILRGDYSTKMKMMNGTAQIVEAVKQDRTGIGYAGIGYVVDVAGKVKEGINVLGIATNRGGPAVSPLEPENVKTGLYPISRPLYQYTDGAPSGGIKQFMQFELSAEGQKIVSSEGYYPAGDEFMEFNKKSGL